MAFSVHSNLKRRRGQVATETVLIMAVMAFLLLAIFLSNEFMRQQNTMMRGRLDASAAANQLAFAINKVASAGPGSRLVFFNSVGQDVRNVTVEEGRVARASYRGGYVSVPLSTDKVESYGALLPINADVSVKNVGGTVYVEGA